MNPNAAVTSENLAFSYQERRALDGVSFSVSPGSFFGVLGPNGGGKTTLFRILATLVSGFEGRAQILGHDLASERHAIRENLGVVFQAPSVDPKLTVLENLHLHGHLYGRTGNDLRDASTRALERLGIADRAGQLVEKLSGGLKRRVELAKCLLSQPRVLILDEPSTGLDPGGRRDLWEHLDSLRAEEGVTVLVTTHLMEEAERCDDLIILDEGRVVAAGSPVTLRSAIGGDVVTIRSPEPETLATRITDELGESPVLVDGSLRIEQPNGHVLVKRLMETFQDKIDGISLAKPTLEDVFIRETGHRFWNAS